MLSTYPILRFVLYYFHAQLCIGFSPHLVNSSFALDRVTVSSVTFSLCFLSTLQYNLFLLYCLSPSEMYFSDGQQCQSKVLDLPGLLRVEEVERDEVADSFMRAAAFLFPVSYTSPGNTTKSHKCSCIWVCVLKMLHSHHACIFIQDIL